MRLVTTLLILATIVTLSYAKKQSNAAGPNHPINAKLRQSYANYMKKTTNPCSNFYKYSCGNWSDYQGEFGDSPYSVPGMLSAEVDKEFTEYMEKTYMIFKPDFVKNAYNFYASCKRVKKCNVLPILDWLEEHENMKWILRMKTVDKNAKFDWVHTLGLMRKYGMNNFLFKETVYTKDTDPTAVIVELSNPNGRSGFDTVAQYEMELLNESKGVHFMLNLMDEIREFEYLFSDLEEIKAEKIRQVMKVKDLPVAWLSEYLSVVLDDVSLDPNMEITIDDVGYLIAADNILKNYTDEFIQRYLELRFVAYVHDNIHIRYGEAECITPLRGLMPLAMHWIYEQMHPELEQEIPKIHQMFDNILKYVNKTLRSDKSGFVPDTFLAKLEKIQLKVGNLPRQDTIKAVDDFYGSLSLTRKDYYGNFLQLMRHRFNIEHFLTTNDVLNKYNEFFDKAEGEDVSENILPRFVANTMIVPSYLLRPPIYHSVYGDLFKQSSLGSVMATYVYSALLMDDGASEDDVEVTAAMGGVHAAYEMFFSTFVPEHMSEYQSTVDVVGVSLKQMFFINAAQYYCQWYFEDERVILSIPALPEFVETFDCKNIDFRKIFEN